MRKRSNINIWAHGGVHVFGIEYPDSTRSWSTLKLVNFEALESIGLSISNVDNGGNLLNISFELKVLFVLLVSETKQQSQTETFYFILF